jgi:hypothetical protein
MISAKAFLLVALVLATAACGGLPLVSAAKPTPTPNPYQASLAYSQCMRTHGVPDYPDPDPSGAVSIYAGPGSDLNPNSAALKAAKQACQSLEAAKGHRNWQESKQRLLAYSACMRSHGLPDFPDPVFTDSGATINPPSDVDPNSPLYKTADQVCRPLLIGGGATPTAGPSSAG